jgi:class 3 adenylate cyclase
MDDNQKALVRQAAVDGLNEAIRTWRKVGVAMEDINESFEARAGNESNIPGHPFVQSEEPEVTEFVALVVDMRNSTDRLQNLQKFPPIKSGFQRVFYETSALLPALATTVLFKDGHVTEYLGDGALILFKVDMSDRATTVREAYLAANDCVTDARQIVNELLAEQFNLPNLSIGAGLSVSNAIVTLVGTSTFRQPKAIGQCVWEASKLSSGVNTVRISENLREAWPSAPGGTLRFEKLRDLPKNLIGFEVRKS